MRSCIQRGDREIFAAIGREKEIAWPTERGAKALQTFDTGLRIVLAPSDDDDVRPFVVHVRERFVNTAEVRGPTDPRERATNLIAPRRYFVDDKS